MITELLMKQENKNVTTIPSTTDSIQYIDFSTAVWEVNRATLSFCNCLNRDCLAEWCWWPNLHRSNSVLSGLKWTATFVWLKDIVDHLSIETPNTHSVTSGNLKKSIYVEQWKSYCKRPTIRTVLYTFWWQRKCFSLVFHWLFFTG